MNQRPEQPHDPLDELLNTAQFPTPDSDAIHRLRAAYASECLRIRRSTRNRWITFGTVAAAAAVIAIAFVFRSLPSTTDRNELVTRDVDAQSVAQSVVHPSTVPDLVAEQTAARPLTREPSAYERLLAVQSRHLPQPPAAAPAINEQAVQLMNKLRDPLVATRLDAARQLGRYASDPQVASRLLDMARNRPGVAREALAALSFAGDAALQGLDATERATFARRMKTAAAVLAEHTTKGEPQ